MHYCRLWNCRNLTLLGKITVIKSLLFSSLNHLFISLPNLDDKTLKKINELFYNFIWEGARRIKKGSLMPICDGGLKMININAFISALETTWLRKLITNNNQWIVILQSCVDIQNISNLGT